MHARAHTHMHTHTHTHTHIYRYWPDERNSFYSLFCRIACISCPTTYYKLQSIKPEGCRAVLLEFDERFQQHGEDFVFYDYNKPLELPADAAEQGSFDIVLADPPFLSDECLEKTSQTVKYLSRGKVLLCTG